MIRSFHLGLALAVGSISIGLRAGESVNQPNILFIAVDDLNHWIGHLGRSRQTKTPHIDRLAKSGVTFTRAYCPAPVCNASRAALMSGLRPSSTGVYDNGQDWMPVIPTEQTLTTQFLKAGYDVFGAGKIYHANAHRNGEWTDYHAGGDIRTRPHAEAKDNGVGGIRFKPLTDDSRLEDENAVDYAVAQLQAKHERPFFLAVGLKKPHMPWNVPKKYYDLFPLEQIELPPTRADDLSDLPQAGARMAGSNGDHARMLRSGRWNEAVQAYLATIAYCDAQIGRLLDSLEQSPYRENTIIVLWGDHGWHLGEKEHWRKFALWEEATRVPYIWVVPGVTKSGGVCDRTVDLMSVYPTLCSLCGLAPPMHVEGEDITPLLADPQSKWNRPALTTFRRNNHTVRTEKWRFIRYADGGEELYDHERDQYEWTNLAGDERFADIKDELNNFLPTTNKPELTRSARANRAIAGAGGRRRTKVDIMDGRWHLNGEVTYRGTQAEGLLINVRMVNATFEDRNRANFDPDANTQRFLNHLSDYHAHGVRAITLNLQGGSPGYEGALNSAFNADGSLRPPYLKRVARVIDACDRQGVAVILGCFYQRQDQVLQDDGAVRVGVVNTVNWIKERSFTNVVLEIANEFHHGGFDREILKTPSGQVELIELARKTNPQLLVSTSGLGGGRLPDDVCQASDFLLIHFNGTAVKDIPARIGALRKYHKPIVCNEDDKNGSEAAQAARVSVENGASWGLMLKNLNQYEPFEFKGAADDEVVFSTLQELTSPSID